MEQPSTVDPPQRVAIYTRVSTDEQAERQTIQNQRDFLRNFANLYDLTIVAEYSDEGISGTVPLSERPDGHQLLKDSRYGRFDCVLLYRVDRLGRSLVALLEAYHTLNEARVTIRSVTEPFDTATPIGNFLFQLLGSLAELEKSTIVERMTLGRDRVARDGLWTGGPIPFGYDIDEDGRLISSQRVIESLQMTESDLARELFQRIANGSSATSEAQRFNSMGVPTTRRYRNGKSIEPKTIWGVSRVINMVNNTVYIGKHSFKSRNGLIVRDVPALVDEATWRKVQNQLKQNRRLPKSNATRDYPLRGLITCVNCGAYFVGTTIPRRNGKRDHYYRCGNGYKRTHHNGKSLCQAKSIPAEQLEDMVWNGCYQLISSPEAALEALQQQLDSRLSETSNVQRERERLSQALLVKDQEKERILTVFRRGRINIDELEHHLEAIHREEADLKQRLGALDAQRQVIDAMTDHFRDANALLGRLRDRLLGLEGPTDPATKHQIITQLVSSIRVETDLTVRPKNAHVSITYILFQPSSAESSMHGSTR